MRGDGGKTRESGEDCEFQERVVSFRTRISEVSAACEMIKQQRGISV